MSVMHPSTLSSQLRDAIAEGAEGAFFTAASFKAATAKIAGRLKDASGTDWESAKVDGPGSRKIAGGTERYVIEKWYPKGRKLQMSAELIVTSQGGKLEATFVIENKLKPVSTEKTSGDLAKVTAWIGNLVSPE